MAETYMVQRHAVPNSSGAPIDATSALWPHATEHCKAQSVTGFLLLHVSCCAWDKGKADLNAADLIPKPALIPKATLNF